ncbi:MULTISPECIES: hemolysin family protein [Rhizobium/Agrobacterium group]|uniref:hemolysin family protein n=1 Tax=Rhizobium/Agrobacterium group TaxID=227290 RepID=UPI0008A75D7A|nr:MULTISPECIES: hemolysin family protein [Rhizobium/Agrobacterium group]MBD8662241.1 HlyC/CorC family transporter [Rhizobium sp. CFBP 8752]MBP2462122.1 putative hemolysin [Rhizobium sp. PvP014]MBP2529518.1 putative hemolysin [Rhizobium sp. PvP099]NSY17181.1 HlyC/CorC family transporter [Neorhizobium sp. AL 9.2.2]SEH21754.1 putative hemolysin [Rhizobium sp. NFR12]
MLTEIFIVVALTILNGVLAMSELAVVSSRPVRLRVMAEQGNRGAAAAIKLAEDPGRFLSSVQIGITLVGVLSGAFSGATLGTRLTNWLSEQGMPQNFADWLGVGGVVVVITYMSLIVGELVPKQIALRAPELVAAKVAPAMKMVATIGAPVVWFLDISGRFLLALLGQSGESNEKVTDEEIRTVLAEAHSAGVIETEESAMISGVMRLADRTARGLMTPRRDVEVLDTEDEPEELRAQLRATTRSRLPVRKGSSDEIQGVLFVKDAYEFMAGGRGGDPASLMREAPVVSDLTGALDVIQALRKSPAHMVLVYDEYGHFEGIITSGDVLEAITGVFQEDEVEEPAIVARDDGSYLVAGWMAVDEFSAQMGVPIEDDPGYETVAGFVLDELKHLPELGEKFTTRGWTFEVIDLDGRRIDKLLLSRAPD